MPHFFISYAKADTQALAFELADILNGIHGLSAWVDRNLTAGRSWEAHIQHEIRKCDYFIVLYSPDINRHLHGSGIPESYVLEEISYARYTLNKPIIPVMAQFTEPPMGLTRIQYINFAADNLSVAVLAERILEEAGLPTEQDRLAAARAEQERIAEQERLASEQAEQERLAAERAEQQRIAAEWAEQNRIAYQKAEHERLAAEKIQQERIAAENAIQEQIAPEYLEDIGHEITWTRMYYIGSAAYSSDGRRMVTTGAWAVIWNTETGDKLLDLQGHSGGVSNAAFSPDGKRVVTASTDKTAMIWDAENGQQLLCLTGHAEGVYTVAYSSDGKRVVTTSGDKTAMIWDAENGQQLVRFEYRYSSLTKGKGIVFTPDGNRVVGIEGDEVVLRDSTSGQIVRRLKGHSGLVLVNDFAIRSDGKRMVTVSKDTAIIWDIAGWQSMVTLVEKGLKKIGSRNNKQASLGLVRRLEHESPEVRAVAYSPDGSRIVTSYIKESYHDGEKMVWNSYDLGGTILWDAENGQQVRTISGGGHYGPIIFSPDGQHIAFVNGGSIFYHNVGDKYAQDPVAIGPHYVKFAKLSHDSAFIVTVSGVSAILWSTRTRELVHHLRVHERPIRSVLFSPNGRYLLTLDHAESFLWDIESGQLLHRLYELDRVQGNEHPELDDGASFSPDSRWVAIAHRKDITIWHVEDGQIQYRLEHPDEPANIGTVLFTSDQQHIITMRKNIAIWRAESGELLYQGQGRESYIESAVLSFDQTRLLTYDHGDIIAWGIPSGNILFHTVLGDISAYPQGMVLSPNQRWIALHVRGENHCAIIYDGETGEVLHQLDLEADDYNPCTAIAFSSSGRQLATGHQEGQVYIWDVESGQCLHRLQWHGHRGQIEKIVFSPDDLQLLALHEGLLIVWDAATGQPLRRLEEKSGTSRRISDLSFGLDSTLVVISDGLSLVDFPSGS